MNAFTFSQLKNSSIESLNVNAPQTALKAGNTSSAILKDIFSTEFDQAGDASESANRK